MPSGHPFLNVWAQQPGSSAHDLPKRASFSAPRRPAPDSMLPLRALRLRPVTSGREPLSTRDPLSRPSRVRTRGHRPRCSKRRQTRRSASRSPDLRPSAGPDERPGRGKPVRSRSLRMRCSIRRIQSQALTCINPRLHWHWPRGKIEDSPCPFPGAASGLAFAVSGFPANRAPLRPDPFPQTRPLAEALRPFPRQFPDAAATHPHPLACSLA